MENKNFYSYTPYFIEWDKKAQKYFTCERATIVLKKVNDDEIHYGVSVCSKGDIWDKKKGRKIAEDRLNRRMGVIKISPTLKKGIETKGEKPILLALLNSITESVFLKMGDYKRKINLLELRDSRG